MRFRAVLFALFGFAACSTTPVARHQSPTTVTEFLLASAAADFHAHRPLVRVRGVRLAHVMNAAGAPDYRLCGEFRPAQDDGKAGWTPFVTIQTSGYEQYLGAQAANSCQGSTVIWDDQGDLSPSLQSRLDSVR